MRTFESRRDARRARHLLHGAGVLLSLAPLFTIAISACDDAILGERVLGCDGGECTDATPLPDAASRSDDGCAPPPVEPSCEAGAPAPTRDLAGCVVGFVCELTCATLDGTCSSRAACPGGRWSTTASTDCAASGTPVEERGCCRSCPAIAAPPADFCDAGSALTGVYEGDCLLRFECQ